MTRFRPAAMIVALCLAASWPTLAQAREAKPAIPPTPPAKGVAKITFDGEQILVDGLKPDRNPVDQALNTRKWLIKLLEERTTRLFPVRAVVVFPGWFVENTRPVRRDDLWVLNPAGIAKFIEHEPVVLKPEDTALASSTLAMYVRQFDE